MSSPIITYTWPQNGETDNVFLGIKCQDARAGRIRLFVLGGLMVQSPFASSESIVGHEANCLHVLKRGASQ
jgi:hypothetical protein